jgi:KH domain
MQVTAVDLQPQHNQTTSHADLFSVICPAAGIVIGREGRTIKQWIQDSGAKIKLADFDKCPVPTERLCAISGELDAVTNALTLIIATLSRHLVQVRPSATKPVEML